jgi:hypothetical protein
MKTIASMSDAAASGETDCPREVQNNLNAADAGSSSDQSENSRSIFHGCFQPKFLRSPKICLDAKRLPSAGGFPSMQFMATA